MNIRKMKVLSFVTAAAISVSSFVSLSFARTDISDFSSNLSLYYSFDDLSVSDLSGNNNNGTLNGTVPPWNVEGINKNAIASYSTGYVETPDSSSLNFGTGDFSISYWIKTRAYSQTVFDKRGGDGYHGYIMNGYPLLQLDDDQNGFYNYYKTETKRVNDDNWHFVTFTVDRDSTTGVDIYVDGELQAELNATYRTGNLSNTVNLLIGKHKDQSSGFNGSIDEFMLFNKSLSFQEVNDLYTATQQPFVEIPSPRAYWTFDSNFSDMSGNGNHITYNYGGSLVSGYLGNALSHKSNTSTLFSVYTGGSKLNVGTGDFSFSCWFKHPSQTNTNAHILSKLDSSGAQPKGYIISLFNGRPSLDIADGITYHSSYNSSAPRLDDNEWHFVVFSVDKDEGLKTYVDGTLYLQETLQPLYYPGNLDTDVRSYFGMSNCICPTKTFKGLLDEMKFFDGALTQEQALALYNQYN